jgi:oxygen-independent coproporphyrinogen-3 oxidase
VRAVHTARDGGIDALSIDLIFALPVALDRDWAKDLDAAVALDPEHVSLYGLTVEPHTPLGRWSARGEVAESPEECYESEFLLAHDRLGAAGFEHYEVSNFARPGKRAVHNSAYWKGVPYFAVGPSAHGFDGVERRWNISAFAAWEAAIARGQDPIEGSETLTTENRIAESVYLGLRTVDGLALLPNEQATVASWHKAGWVELIDNGDAARVRCTPLGWLRLDSIAADLTALRSHS